MVKHKVIWRKAVAIALCLAGSATAFAQERTIQVMKDGVAVFSAVISGNEKIVFQDPGGGTVPPSNDAVIVQLTGGETAVKALLDNIKEITLAEGNLSVIPFSGTAAVYALGDVEKLSFGEGEGNGIHAPQASGREVGVYLNPAGNVVVECAAGILSLTLFSIDGKIIAAEKCTGGGVETLRTTSLQKAGIYLIRVETPQGTSVKKLIINH